MGDFEPLWILVTGSSYTPGCLYLIRSVGFKFVIINGGLAMSKRKY